MTTEEATKTELAVKAEALIDCLNWRYATKKFDDSKKIEASVFETLQEALCLSSSSYGMQPWKFIVVTDPAVKKELAAASYNQKQPADCSHLIVIARVTKIDQAYVDHYVEVAGRVRKVDAEKKAAFTGMLSSFVNSTPEPAKEIWSANQCYIALGVLLTAAAALGVDACPMEGFDKAAYDRILDLPAKGCQSVVICPLGYRSDEDHYANLGKVRFPASEVVINV